MKQLLVLSLAILFTSASAVASLKPTEPVVSLKREVSSFVGADAEIVLIQPRDTDKALNVHAKWYIEEQYTSCRAILKYEEGKEITFITDPVCS